jgi:hypothetical protein
MTVSRPFFASVPADPLPWLTERFREYGVYDPEASDVLRMARILGVAQSTVNALSDGRKSFRVKFSSGTDTALTDGKTHEVIIGTGPALDPDLSDGQRAAILVAMAAHEVGHVRWSVTMTQRLMDHYQADPFKQAWALRVFNIAHDIHLEHWMRKDFRVLETILDLKGLYFCSEWTFTANRNVERYGALINATLYPHATDWSGPEAAEFKAFADQWAEKAKAKAARTIKPMVALIEEALEFLRYDSEPDVPEDETGGLSEPSEPSEPGEGEEGESEATPSDPEEGEDDEGEGTGSSEAGDEDDAEFREPQQGGMNPPESRDDTGEKHDPSSESEEDEGGEGDGGEATPGSNSDSSSVDRPPKQNDGGLEEDRWDDEDVFREHLDDGGETTSYTDRPPLPTIHGSMHTADDAEWQDAIDSHMRSMTSERDRWVVGGTGPFAKREMRVVRIQR